MLGTKRNYLAGLAIAAAAFGIMSFESTTTVAQEGGVDIGQALRNNIVTKVVTIKIESARGEPKMQAATADFDRVVDAYWISVVGQDVKFTRSTEKQVNRVLFAVDPFARVINGKQVEVSGKLGIRDGSGDWDDSYEGTITVAVTAILTK